MRSTCCPSAHLAPGNEAALPAPRSDRGHHGSGGLGLWFKGTLQQEAEPRLEPTARERAHPQEEPGGWEGPVPSQGGASSFLEAIQSRGKPTSMGTSF